VKLNLINNQISDISAVSGLTNLTALDLSGNQISEISGISGLENLAVLDLGENQIIDISGLSGSLPNLKELYLGDNGIDDISAVSSLTSLRKLHLYRNQIRYISEIGELTNLTDLNLSSNRIRDMSAVKTLRNLAVLSMSNNEIRYIDAVSDLTNLKALHLGSNEIEDISAVGGLTNLTILDLSNNPISDVNALAGLKNLMELNREKITDNSRTDTAQDKDADGSDMQSSTGTRRNIKVEVVSFKEKEFERYVREKINKNEGDIYNIDLQGITTILLNTLYLRVADSGYPSDILGITSINISNFEDLGLFPDLNALHIYGMEVDADDLKFIAQLKNINRLVLDGCDISDISALRSLTDLDYLT
jgi:Leucine-rich repeat (LRR) protein